MQLTFRVPTLQQVLDTTLWTQEDGVTPYWRDGLYQEYSEIDKGKALSLAGKERMKYVGDILSEIYQAKKNEFQSLVQLWQEKWNEQAPEIEKAFSCAYEVDVGPILNNMVGYVNLNPVCPRYLDSHTFYVFYKMDVDRVIRTALHEIMHFVWFYKWQEYFHDDPQEYDTPHLKWIFSEMVQDTMVKNTPIKNLAKWQKNAYDYFYTMDIEGKPILKTLSDIYRTKGLIGLFKDGFNYCKMHEVEIRKSIEEAENCKGGNDVKEHNI